MRIVYIVEIIGAIIAVAVVAWFAAQFSIRRDRTKRLEAWHNLQQIRLAVDRYTVDKVEYPPYLIGGTRGNAEIKDFGSRPTYKEGEDWRKAEEKWVAEALSDSARVQISDPLIRNGYLDSYPKNPFVTYGGPLLEEQRLRHDPLCPDRKDGFGDKHGYRFGHDGRTMGNVMAELRFTKWTPSFKDGSGKSVKGKQIPTGADVNFHQYDLYPDYRDPERQTALPGQFLYKAHTPYRSTRRRQAPESPFTKSVRLDALPPEFDWYVLGVMGPVGMRGYDELGAEPVWSERVINPDGTVSLITERSYLGQENEERYTGYLYLGSPFGTFIDGGWNPNNVPDGILAWVLSNEEYNWRRFEEDIVKRK